MRRALSTALLATVLLGAAACGDKAGDPAAETSTPATVTSPTPAVAALDKAASCRAITEDLAKARLKGIEAMGSALGAMTDPSKKDKAIADIKAMFAEMQALTDKHLPAAGDPEVKAALTEFQTQAKARAAAIEAAGTDIEKAIDGLDDPAFEAAGDKLDTLCA